MVRAVLDPIPETDNKSRNISRSDFSANPNKVCESSFTCKWVKSMMLSESPILEYVCKEILTKYPTPEHSMTTWVGFFSTNFPFRWVTINVAYLASDFAFFLLSLSCASTTATADMLTISSTLAPNCMIWTDLRNPTIIGPIESALFNSFRSL